ncbi:bifunctional adenosylcobinamide kinase/adenosylcobinamide-phosphate guanylyltransferase [Alkalihalobacillus sp. MEB130]|uniref:bifunctional adenosylcobinamide kinase/adenosylcobinamide-phosphate guanylyltransferase n=1 Tax=Alkalihalobacillus sp. MEB130 TaxID=2976704 RepID=UPI0028DF012F|nr:bifunctional adenosylcobinamide kinase/adenosylcobinamide-phosphate guanylyltransferase [Alkalihalobacillus sp. MEB130]MDT8859289.1 bifunctional adenosylcobinamide kinase/adenosylcobinamide-phosphate guanylyltransferase [Alkalihalobacillus sp. MEB130]
MQLIIGGAFSGKRAVVKDRKRKCSWVSSYEGDLLIEWETKWKQNSILVLEGWEKWLADELEQTNNLDQIRRKLKSLFQTIKDKEQEKASEVILIMLEVGRGIVPLEKRERSLRDLAGWVAQDAAEIADQVIYVWNGLSKRLK